MLRFLFIYMRRGYAMFFFFQAEDGIRDKPVTGVETLFCFQAEDGIRDKLVTGVQTCALPIWSIMSVDQERGILFVPLTSPASDYYGGDRKGANLFGDCVLALDAATGKRLWHFQTIHHDLWDWDLPAQPILVTLRRDGKDIPAVAQVTKTGFVFILDRLTGKPLFDVVERPVPQSEAPGEQSWPTQPFPVKPPPYARQTMSWDELTDVTPESRAECQKLIEGALTGPMFRPIGLQYTVMFPGTNGGANWGGGSYDPKS